MSGSLEHSDPHAPTEAPSSGADEGDRVGPPRQEQQPQAGTTTDSATTTVTANINATVTRDATLLFAVAVSADTPIEDETLTITVDGTRVEVEEIVSIAGTRLHRVLAPPGALELRYAAEVRQGAQADAVTPEEEVLYVRPSRYCESDRFNVLAPTLFPGLAGQELITAVGEWVRDYLRYIPGISGSADSAIDTLLAGQGVCRDFAHLTVTMLRAMGVPARLTAVYAPGLVPMDFHAVAEAAHEGRWQVVDSTRMAPRASLIRIATGRDAADTAFFTVLSGGVNFGPVWVTAYANGGLPHEDPSQPVHL
ncbi:transglutaminase-like domain-containing protein [Aestuariimicrobium ganziense]|uniref:transglutaminase-like domain-containing protein n=1 Tax=Aestuariimicrobium ganziense TaxID=2773677 RepID=UPI001944DD9D|nr:transglutaminase family protein [Aestuariimicrobium ganziense]